MKTGFCFPGAMLLLASSLSVAAQSVDFRNNQTQWPTPADRDIYDANGVPLVGTNYQARLLYGSNASNLQPATYSNPARFRNVTTGATIAGTWQGSNRTLAGFNSGDTVTLVVQVWDAGPDLIPGSPMRTFEQARASGKHLWLESAPFTYTIPPSGSAITSYYMDNFRGIRPGGCAAPGRLSILETNSEIRLTFSGVQPVEASDDLVRWTPLGAQASPFVDSDAAGLTRRFYRLRCDDLFSPNYVGFYRQAFYWGYTFFGNHLLLPDDRFSQIFPRPPEGTTIYVYHRPTGGYVPLTYLDGIWEGGDDMRFPPGTGAIMSVPAGSTSFAKTFVGEVILRSTNVLETGYSLISSMLPQSLPLTGAGGLGFPIAEGDTIYQFNPVIGAYNLNQFIDGAWEGDNAGSPPVPALGECFFLFREQPGSWILDITPSP